MTNTYFQIHTQQGSAVITVTLFSLIVAAATLFQLTTTHQQSLIANTLDQDIQRQQIALSALYHTASQKNLFIPEVADKKEYTIDLSSLYGLSGDHINNAKVNIQLKQELPVILNHDKWLFGTSTKKLLFEIKATTRLDAVELSQIAGVLVFYPHNLLDQPAKCHIMINADAHTFPCHNHAQIRYWHPIHND